jgi:integrase
MNTVPMTDHVERYLALRRAMGFELSIAGKQLMQFARFVQASDAGSLTLEVAVAWANSACNGTPITRARRIEIVRPFAKYLRQVDPITEVPERGLFGRAHRRLTPHIFTTVEIEQLLTAAARLAPTHGLRPLVYQTLFGLIAATGLRLGEALRLDLDDVDLVAGTLAIRRTKFRKSRLVALHSTTVEHLLRYIEQRGRSVSITRRCFVDGRGNALNAGMVEHVFRTLRAELGWQPRGGHRTVRIYDLRHTFITRRLADWQANGTDIDQATLALSTYVGHAKVTDTYWYLTAIPELMQAASVRFQRLGQGDDHG